VEEGGSLLVERCLLSAIRLSGLALPFVLLPWLEVKEASSASTLRVPRWGGAPALFVVAAAVGAVEAEEAAAAASCVPAAAPADLLLSDGEGE